MFENLRIAPLLGRVTFDILNTDLAIVNGIRRVMLSDIPTIGFLGEGEPTITIHTNTGALHNEFMSHRIGMIPIHMTEEDTEAFQEGLYEFNMSVKNTKDVTINVTTHDFTGTHDGNPLTEKQLKTLFPKNKVTDDPILITRLRPGEEISLTARPIKSTARHHASFSPVSMCSFHFIQDPVEAEKADGILNKERAFLRNEYNEPTAIEFSFEIENGNAMKETDATRYLVSKAFDVLIQKLDKALQHDEEYVTCKELPNGFEFTFENEDDTLGNLLQSLMFNRHVREGHPFQDVKISYVGYVCPHPLDPTMVLKVMFEDEKVKHDVSFAWSLLMDNCSWIKSTLTGINNEWLQFIQKNTLMDKDKEKVKKTPAKKAT
jgi:DNA-directed RNA polymerase alpha subunit/DNA-directed RNA polymerase subunit L